MSARGIADVSMAENGDGVAVIERPPMHLGDIERHRDRLALHVGVVEMTEHRLPASILIGRVCPMRQVGGSGASTSATGTLRLHDE